MELNEFHVLVGQTGPGHHGRSVASAGMGRSGREESLAVTTASQHGVLSLVKETNYNLLELDPTGLTIGDH